MSKNSEIVLAGPAAGYRVILAIILPLAAALVTSLIVGSLVEVNELSSQATTAVLLSSIAIVSWLIGVRWYGAQGMGLRGGRPLYAGIGFAVLGWIIFLLIRLFFVDVLTLAPSSPGRTYIYILLFEALATQIWTFGLLFHAVSDWRGPLTAAITGGILFGLVAASLFQEAFRGTQLSLIYFIVWGILYGIIRLRSGSLWGTVLVQSLHSFSVWVAFTPFPRPDPGQLQSMYLTAAVAYSIVIWRLWPKKEEDYRV